MTGPSLGPLLAVATAEQRARELAAAVDGRLGWQPVTVHLDDGRAVRVWFVDAVVAEYQPGPGRPGGTVIGTQSGWRWTAHDGAGRTLGGNLDGLVVDTAYDALAGVLQAIDPTRDVPDGQPRDPEVQTQ